ncbi:MAG: AMP-binding protein [Gemmatimonadetes bacterium]|nr:AMP-binding protein [Gemmatimonadota bacterium]
MELMLITRARGHGVRAAVVAAEGTFSYSELLDASARVASALLGGGEDLEQARIAFLVPRGFQYVAVQWGIWRAGGIAVPLAVSHPARELEYVVADADASAIVAHPDFEAVLKPIATSRAIRFVSTTEVLAAAPPLSLPGVDERRRGLILYTSGTTGRPKGVVLTHANLRAQVSSLVAAWGWSAHDRILGVLPLHHTHGIINVLSCALWPGACCELLPAFDAERVWQRFADGDVTVFMAVPTIYARLIAAWETAPAASRKAMSDGCARMRLMVSGSAALPVRVFERWREITGHTLLERYGMTEIGMALSNPLRGERVAGSVGTPLPGVEVRLVDEEGRPVEPGAAGEIQVRGPAVFLEYWRRPDATAEAFRDGWFMTGDLAVVENGRYRILGRKSVDIIKTGAYKVSALEIEDVLREHPDVRECAVVGIPDPEWGERVAAAVITRHGNELDLQALRDWARQRLAPYKLPARLLVVPDLPRNAMGKVQKPEVTALFEAVDRV